MPPKKNKKPSKNGYWQFVLECRDKNPNKSMGDMQIYASRKWANMSKEEREPYENMARLARDTYQPVKYTTDGLEIDEVERQQEEKATKVQLMKDDINRAMKCAKFAKTLEDQVFLLVHVNHLVYHPLSDRYFVCEIAIATVTLRNGVEEVHHQIIKPGKLPLGFYGPALAHSKETHQMIELVQDEPFEDNTHQVFRNIISLMKNFATGNTLPVLYADEKTIEMIKNVFANWCVEFDFRSEIKIYSLEYLFYALRNAVAQRQIWPNETFSHSVLEKDIYSYTPNISCDYHEVTDISVYCSKSIVTRYGFTICDHCCADLGIQLRPGYHVPQKSKIVVESRTSSQAPSLYDDFIPVKRRGRDDSVSSEGYDANYPPLGSSSASVVSFSSMKSLKNAQTGSKAASRIEQSFKALSVSNQVKRDHGNLKFPARGCDRQN